MCAITTKAFADTMALSSRMHCELNLFCALFRSKDYMCRTRRTLYTLA